MKLFPVVSVLVGAVASVLGQTIELGYPTAGTVLSPGQNFTSQVVQPVSTQRDSLCVRLKSLVSGILGILHSSRHCPRDEQLQQRSLSTADRPAWRCPLCWSLESHPARPGRVLPELLIAGSWIYASWICHLHLDASLLAWGMLSLTFFPVRCAEAQAPLQAGPYPFLEFRNASLTIE